eukprot:1160482-Pelagomonas_calceolata.AAC.12
MSQQLAVSSEYNGACCASFASLPTLAGWGWRGSGACLLPEENTPDHQHPTLSNSQAVAVKCVSAKHTLELMHSTSTELSPGGRLTGFFCFAGCPFLDAWALASLAWSAKRCWAGVTGLSHLAKELEL